MALIEGKTKETKGDFYVLSSELDHPYFIPQTTPTPAESVSTYHIYHQRRFHYRLSHDRDAYKDKVVPFWPEYWRYSRRKWQTKLEEKLRPSHEKDPYIDAPGYFVHKPRIFGGHVPFRTPRTLRLGQSKKSPPLCLIHTSWFWRRWKIQFCDGLDEPGVVDPRGVVGASYGYANRRDAIRRGGNQPNGFIKGYAVKRVRLCGDTGKEYHRCVNRERKGKDMQTDEKATPLEVSTVVSLVWDAPFTHEARRYSFRYGGLNFYWKGTSVVHYPGLWGFSTIFNHLKLVVEVPVVVFPSIGPGTEQNHIKRPPEFRNTRNAYPQAMLQTCEVILATYVASPAPRKAGILHIRNDALMQLLKTYLPSHYECLNTQLERHASIESTYLAGISPGLEQLADSQLYKCVIATAVCMVIAEQQKREWAKHILKLVAKNPCKCCLMC